MNCPICTKEDLYQVHNTKRVFYRCTFCGFSFVDPTFYPDAETQKRRYELHNNSEKQKGYVDFLSDIIDRALFYKKNPEKVLDFGSGPNPLAVKLLKERNIDAYTWDIFFANESFPVQESFDIVLCIEVAEHFIDLQKDFYDLARVLKQNGFAFVHTHISPRTDEDFLCWWYIQDITHISFYSKKSLEILASMNSLDVISIEKEKLSIFKRK